jgi:hypothetical protein
MAPVHDQVRPILAIGLQPGGTLHDMRCEQVFVSQGFSGASVRIGYAIRRVMRRAQLQGLPVL